MSLRALIVDDEVLARRSIRRFLQSHVDVEIIGECGDGESAITAIQTQQPDLVFLDVQMPEADGFAVVERVGVGQMPVTIFVTAYDQYALHAFDANAIDYLLKPFGPARFERALARAQERLSARSNEEVAQRVRQALAAVRDPGPYWERIAVPERGRLILVPVHDIHWIEAVGNLARLHTGARRYEIRETLSSLERKLNPKDFVRIHRSTIVNVNHIQEIQPWFHGYHVVLLDSGQQLRMSRYQGEVCRRLGFKGKG